MLLLRYLKSISSTCLILTANTLLANEVHEFTLDNGLHLIIKEDHRAPIVVSQIWYKVGGSYELEGKTGLSHLLEHMMFKGTQKYPTGEFSRIMAINGASENAFTGVDYTAYFQTLEKSHLAISFELEADRMQNLVWSDKEFAKEKQVVMEERRTRVEDDPTSLLEEHFRATAFQTSPYQHPLSGWMSDIANLTLADLKNWYQRWYAPNNATVIVIGDVEPQSVLTLAKQHFDALKPRELTPPMARPEIEQLGIKRLVVKKPAKLPHLLMGYHIPSLTTLPKANHGEVYALELLAYILDGGTSARLTKNLVRGQQIATSVSVGYDPFSRLEDLFVVSSIPTEKHTPAELEIAILEQIKQLQTTPITEKELTRVKNQLRASKVYELDSQFYQGMQIGILRTVGLDWHLLDNYLDNIKAVTAQQIQAVANKYLITDKLTVAVLEPLPLTTNAPNTIHQPSTAVVH